MARFCVDYDKLEDVFERFIQEVPPPQLEERLYSMGLRQKQFQEWCIANFGAKIHSRTLRSGVDVSKSFYVVLDSEEEFIAFLLRL